MRVMRREFVLGLVAMALMTACAIEAATPSTKALQQNPPSADSKRAVLVELFTSEGCSSCPPADDLLRAIDGKYDHGSLMIGISEHVTYWDHDGWMDRFDSDAITDRQNDYGQQFHIDSVYTPQMVVNGETQLVGSDSKALREAVHKAEAENGPTVSIISAKLDGDAVSATVSFAGELPKHGADVFAVVAQDETTEHVLRGENKGRTLSHASVARVLVKAARIHEAGESTVRVALPSGFAATAGTRRHLIIWVQEPNAGRVLGVDTKPL
jgi:hypothetical protein